MENYSIIHYRYNEKSDHAALNAYINFRIKSDQAAFKIIGLMIASFSRIVNHSLLKRTLKYYARWKKNQIALNCM